LAFDVSDVKEFEAQIIKIRRRIHADPELSYREYETALFFPSISEVSLAIWFGVSGFIVLVVLNLSGLLTESKRKSREFGPLRRLHVVLMLTVLVLSIAHIELVVGPSFLRSIVEGAIIASVVTFVVFVSVPITLRAMTPR
jgi:xanthine/uracil/vitamin C permease (AzgA family)